MIRTDDLFLGGFCLSRGGELVGIDVEQTNGRKVAVFVIDGAAVAEAERAYFSGGKTEVDLQHLKVQVRRLKERAFAALRDEDRKPRARAR